MACSAIFAKKRNNFLVGVEVSRDEREREREMFASRIYCLSLDVCHGTAAARVMWRVAFPFYSATLAFFCCDILQRFSRHDKIIIFKMKMLPSTTIILIHKIVYSEWSRIIQWLSRQGQLMSVISPFWSSVLESNPEKNGRRRCHVKKKPTSIFRVGLIRS